MPISKYNPFYGGKPGAAAKALASMQDEYGGSKGTSVFYALKNKRKASGWTPRAPRGRAAIAEPGKPVVRGTRVASV